MTYCAHTLCVCVYSIPYLHVSTSPLRMSVMMEAETACPVYCPASEKTDVTALVAIWHKKAVQFKIIIILIHFFYQCFIGSDRA